MLPVLALLLASALAAPNDTGPNLIQQRVDWASVAVTLVEQAPPLAPLHAVSELCRNSSLQYLADIRALSLPALKMWDASGKVGSGVLSGNVNLYGDYDECVGAGGRYCLAYLDLRLPPAPDPYLATLHRLAHSHYAFKSTLADPGNRVPRFSTVHWGVCAPAGCSPEEVEAEVEARVGAALRPLGLSTGVSIRPQMCSAPPPKHLHTGTKIALVGFTLLAGLLVLATLYDFTSVKPPSGLGWEALSAFSLKRNLAELVKTTPPADDVPSLHGVRLFNAIMLYISHKSLAIFYNPYINRTPMTEMLGKPWTAITRAASLYTDPFIMLSGLLTAYSLGRSLRKPNGSVNRPKEFIYRIIRLVPSLVVLIAFCTWVLPELGSGPQWPLVVDQQAVLCKQFWWRNLFLIHNYFGFRNMCLTHTHHVGIDTQLFVAALVIVPLLYKYPKQGLVGLTAVGFISTLLRFYTTYWRQLNLYIHFGSRVSQMFDTADYTYILPTHRATVYVMGLALGYLLRHTPRSLPLKKSQLTLGWFLAGLMLYQSVGPSAKMGDIAYKYEPGDAAAYAAFSPIAWCLFFSWLVFASHTGNAGWVSDVLSWKYWQVTTRISYSVYLTQFPIFFYNVGRIRHSHFFNILVMVDVIEIAEVLVASVLLTVAVEMPCQHLRKLFLNSSPAAPTKVSAASPVTPTPSHPKKD